VLSERHRHLARTGWAQVRDALVRAEPAPQRSDPPICVRVDQALRILDIGKTKLYELIALASSKPFGSAGGR
jgi:hypothetical protein